MTALANFLFRYCLFGGDLDFPHVVERFGYLLQAIPVTRGVEIPGTAHLPNLEQPEQVNKLLRNFLL